MVCYYCGEPDVSKEHVPPQCFFPENRRSDLISVPSCDEHNSRKSKDDEYFRAVFLSSILVDGNPDVVSQREAHTRALAYAAKRATSQIHTKEVAGSIIEIFNRYETDPISISKAITELEERKLLRTGLLGLVNRDPQEERVKGLEGEDILTTSFAFDLTRMARFLEGVARALLFKETKEVWNGLLYHHPHTFLREDASYIEKDISEHYRKALVREDAKGAHKTIFYYDIFRHLDEQSGKPNGYAVGFCFFDTFQFTTVFIQAN